MSSVTYQLPMGTIVGDRYRIHRVLGEGGYGITYLGTDLRLNLPVAVKEYFPGFWASRYCERSLDVMCPRENSESYEKGIVRFRDEALVLAHLHNIPEIVLVRDFFEENNTAYLVMEFLDGKDLKAMTDGFGGRIPAEILMPVVEPLILAIKKVHDRGLIHRDISPDNIMMLENGNVKILDFGNARDANNQKSMTLAMKQGFAPPEQYRTKGQGTWTDVYGLCATIYYCLTGKLPVQALDRLMGTEFPSLSEMGISLPAHQEAAIMRGLDLFVNKRIQNMDELWNEMYNQVQPEAQSSEKQADGEDINEEVQPATGFVPAKTEVSVIFHETEDIVSEVREGNRSFRDVCIQIFKKLKGNHE